MEMPKNKFVALDHYDYPGKQDHLDILLEGFSLIGGEESPLVKFESSDELLDLKTAEFRSSAKSRYLDYEGAIDKNRGFVRRIDSGNWQINDQGEIVLIGSKISGKYILTLRRVE